MSEAAKSFSQSDALRFRAADLADFEALVHLINSAFRVELPYIEGDRIDAPGVRSYMAKGKFFLAEDSSGLACCVYVELRGDRGYLVLLFLDPSRQGTVLVRKLMDAAENSFRQSASVAVILPVTSARTSLPA